MIQSAAGGIGLAALDMCRIYGAETIGIASAAKHAFLHSRGLDHAIDAQSADVLKQISKGEGVEIVLDSQGGPSWRQSYDLLALTGRLLTFGVSSPAPGRRSLPSLLRLALTLPRFTPLRLMDENKGVLGVNVGHLWHKSHLVRGWAEQILFVPENGRLIRCLFSREHETSLRQQCHQKQHDRRSWGCCLACGSPM